jgi:methionyl-tRNA synthetase
MAASINKFYVTTPIYYGTAKPHIGSLYSTLLADVTARWNTLQGKKIFFLTGTDEHGQKIARAAQQEEITPKELVDRYVKDYKETWHTYHIDYTKFIRTTDEYHIQAVQQWIKYLQEKGDIYKDFYLGWYCTPCETFVSTIDVPPPCEKCGKTPHERIQEWVKSLQDKGNMPYIGFFNERYCISCITFDDRQSKTAIPSCDTCGRATEEVAEETYFFKLSAYQDKLLELYRTVPDFIIPKERLNEVIRFVESGLTDLSISRTTVTWGVPFPYDSAHIAYVWIDALNNYITAIGYGQKGHEETFHQWWPADLQVMGKDIVRFHAVYWPAFLMASGLEVPKQLLVHGWITIDDKKMSKSLGNVVDPMELAHTYGADCVRYYLLRHMAITHDSSFSTQGLKQVITSELAHDLGNLCNRMHALADQHKLTTLKAPLVWSKSAALLHDQSVQASTTMCDYMDEYQVHMALGVLWKFINQTNAYFHEQEPWKRAQDDKSAFEEVLSATAHALHTIAILLWPVMPDKMHELLSGLGVSIDLENNMIEKLQTSEWNSTYRLNKPRGPLFTQYEAVETEQKTFSAPDISEISIDDVAKVHLVVGTIKACEPIQKSDRLLKLDVSFGDLGTRQILAGIKKVYTPKELIGKQGVFVFNLKPRKMLGLESQGMLLLAADTKGAYQLISPHSKVPDGTRLR